MCGATTRGVRLNVGARGATALLRPAFPERDVEPGAWTRLAEAEL
jgi:hypothetical protein